MISSALPFAKMNGIGNAILVVDLRGSGVAMASDAARVIGGCEGFDFDQLMTVGDPRMPGTDAFVEIFNLDGSRAEACGNGTRCVAWFLLRGEQKTHISVQTEAGELRCERLGPTRFSVDMGSPRLGWRDIPLAEPVGDTGHVALPPMAGLPASLSVFSGVNMGNPHAVFFTEDVASVPLERIGSLIEHHPMFPDRTNVSFAEIRSRTHVALRVWERSAGATLACGSAACATLVAAVRAGATERLAVISLPGGDLTIEWRQSDGHVIMAGDVELEREGVIPSDILDDAA